MGQQPTLRPVLSQSRPPNLQRPHVLMLDFRYFKVLLSQVCKIRHLAMESAFTSICEKMCRFLKSSVKRGIVIASHCGIESVCAIPSLRYSTINRKWHHCRAEVKETSTSHHEVQTTQSYRAESLSAERWSAPLPSLWWWTRLLHLWPH